MATLSVRPNPRVTYKAHYEDEHLLVVEKAARLVTQPGKGHEDDTLLNGLFAKYGTKLQNLGAERDFGLLHRLDRETSGLLLVGLSRTAYDGLRKQFEEREIKKFYWAVCTRVPKASEGVIRKPIAEATVSYRAGESAKKLAKIAPSGKASVTAYRVLNSSAHGALLECRPVTGRLHQVRVHLASIGCPIAGDGLYGDSDAQSLKTRLALHAHRIVFTHPVTGDVVDSTSPWPGDLKRVLAKLKLERPGGE